MARAEHFRCCLFQNSNLLLFTEVNELNHRLVNQYGDKDGDSYNDNSNDHDSNNHTDSDNNDDIDNDDGCDNDSKNDKSPAQPRK